MQVFFDQEFQVGEAVAYESKSNGNWITAIVTKINIEQGSVTYDLDVKTGVLPHKISKITSTDHIHSTSSIVTAQHKVDEHVAYWSQTLNAWVPAVVQKINYDQGSLTYDLDVKSGALPSNVRKLSEQVVQGSQTWQRATKLRLGCKVRLCGLKNASRLNGQRGTLASFVQDSARWRVTLDDGQSKDVKAENIVAEDSGDDMPRPPTQLSSVLPVQPIPQTVPQTVPMAQTMVIATEAQYQIGERVEFWNVTNIKWIPAVVQQKKVSTAGAVTYDLDVQKGALPSQIRRPASSFLTAESSVLPIPNTSYSFPPTPATASLTNGYGHPTTPRNSSFSAEMARRASKDMSQVPTPFGARSNSPFFREASLGIEDLQIGPGNFDPSQPQIRSQLMVKLGFSGDSVVQALTGTNSGRNEGLWTMTCPGLNQATKYILKLISCHRIERSHPTETETFLKLSQEHPGLLDDREVSFPLKLFSCQNPGPRRFDLIVMKSAPGTRLTEVLHTKWHMRQVQDIMKILRCVGACLKRFHMRYRNTRHGDFNTSNIFWDDASSTVTIIDLGGMGCPTVHSDNEYFKQVFRMMTSQWGTSTEEGCRAFDAGYNEPKSASKEGRSSIPLHYVHSRTRSA
jgi:tRNA A-37 threonylcarbamoyl transferase component Bud32